MDSLKDKKILIVDDCKSAQYIAKKQLEKIGINNIDTANNGLEAIQKAKEQLYDIILMDILMPNMSGIESSKEIRKGQNGKQIKIIAHTAIDPSTIKEKNELFDGLLRKPIGLENMKQKIFEVLLN